VHDGHTMEPPDALQTFRRSFYQCFHRRRDALFELADAILSADGAAPSPAHLSLQASHRRGWGSLYAALDRARIDEEALRKLLARHPLAGTEGEPIVYAVDASVWARCDAECSPERGFYYHPSRHSAGQPIVAGWAYQFVAQLNFVGESWTAPVDVERVRPAQGANKVACGQVKVLLDRLGKAASAPLFVFDAGYDPVKVQQGLEGSQCQILLRLRAGRRFYGDPSLCDPPEHIGRPRRHGPKMKCADPVTWPQPSAEHRSVKRPVTELCACGRGLSCTPRSTTTHERALGDPCQSWSARSSWWRSSVCPGARGGGSRGFCGYGGADRRERRRI
jgi:DDE superfamily endonuclease